MPTVSQIPGRWRAGACASVALAALALVLLAPSAVARTQHKPTAAQQVATAARLVARLPRARFAPGARRRLLLAAARATRLTRVTRLGRVCQAVAATDAFFNALVAPTTWKRRRVPSSLIRAPRRGLASAEARLVKRAGNRCARPARLHPIKPHIGGSGSPKVAPPKSDPEQGDGLDHPLGQGKLAPPKTIGGGSGLGADPHGGLSSPFSSLLGATVAGPTLSFFRNSDVGVPPRQASPQEPTTAVDPSSGVAWYTGNTSVGLSTDNGRTWKLFDPSSVLPDGGLAFCCDQLVSYSPQYGMFVWVSQYWCNGGGCLTTDNKGNTVCRTDGAANRIRIAVASPAALRANATNPGRAWTYWDITPGLIGQPANSWFDRSDMSVNPWNFNWGVDILCGNAGNLLSRISLSQLAARGSVTLSYITDSGVRTTAQGSGTTTTYFAGANSLSQARIWSWAPFSGTLFRHDINHTTVPIYNNAITGSDGSNWYDRYGIFPGEVESATFANNTLYLAQGTGRAYCTANCSTATPTLNQVFTQPSIFISKFDVNSWTDVGERWLWNSTLGFGWPALATDGAGDVGIAFRTSATNHNAQPVAGFLTPSEQFVYADPEGQAYETGDYYSLRPGRTSQSFVMTAQTVQNDPTGTQMHWFYVEYGLGPAPYVSPPSVHIVAPANLSAFTQGASVNYAATVSDPIDGTLPAGAITWTEDGAFIGNGASISHIETAPGTHTINVSATNGDGKSASDTITIRVSAPPGPIKVAITSPADGSAFGPGTFDNQLQAYCSDVPFTATASGGSGALSYSWDDVKDGIDRGQVSTALSPTLHLCTAGTFNTSSTHDLTLTVTDGTTSTIAQIRVIVYSPRLG